MIHHLKFPVPSFILNLYLNPLYIATMLTITLFILATITKRDATQHKGEMYKDKSHKPDANKTDLYKAELYKATSKSKGVIIGKNNCGYCDKAIGLLKEANIEFTYIPTESSPILRKIVVEMYEHKTVPIIFMDNRFVGGCSELVELLDE